jgi:hypothetical protein
MVCVLIESPRRTPAKESSNSPIPNQDETKEMKDSWEGNEDGFGGGTLCFVIFTDDKRMGISK